MACASPEREVRLFTAAYGAWSRRPGMGTPVACSLLLPKWLPEAEGFPRCWAVTPRFAYWRSGWPDEFARHYLSQLERSGARKIARYLHHIAAEAGSDRLVLLCYEPLAADCHRLMFADWWLVTTGERIEELT
jgi:hypothetical protein